MNLIVRLVGVGDVHQTVWTSPSTVSSMAKAASSEPGGESTRFHQQTDDGTIAGGWTKADDEALRGRFEPGLRLDDRYLLEHEIGRGGMGVVFKALDQLLNRPVAIKVVRRRKSTASSDRALDSELAREARLGAYLNHPGIATVLDFGFHDDNAYTVFEFVEGEPLRRILNRRERLRYAEVCQILAEVARALDFAHSKGIIHRDLKPENICLTPNNECKILDLGLARDLRKDAFARIYSGTPAYSSPEQARKAPTHPKSDQYSLALIAYELLAGQRAFRDANPHVLLEKQIEELPPSLRQFAPDIPAGAEVALNRALQKDAADRFTNCQEFAAAFGATPNSRKRSLINVPFAARVDFYIAHVGDDSVMARRVANGLEGEGFSCWYYGRNAVPGLPLLTQARAAIDRAHLSILLISKQTIRSSDVVEEIEHANKRGCPLLSILVDLSRQEFDELNLPWVSMLGPPTFLEQSRMQPIDELLARVIDAAEALEVAPKPHTTLDSSRERFDVAGQPWATDAVQIDIHDLDRVIYRNELIDDFVDRKHKCFVSATKGLGKTLLLTYKRYKLTEVREGDDRPVTMIPEGRPFLDFMTEMKSLSAKFQKPLSELSTTKRLWSAALRISILSHHPALIDDNEAAEVNEFPDRMQRWLRGQKVEPTVVFKEATSLQVSELNRLIDKTENFLDQKLRQLHSGCCVFIDKVDQAIHHLSRDAWIYIQAGLIEAAWEIMNANSHVKIYASIRQEAFANYESDIKSNLFGATTTLQYSDADLAQMLDRLSWCYEGEKSFADFLGLNVIRHAQRPAPEDIYEFVYRHTFGRPRDLVAIASEVSARRSSLDERRLREVVREAGASSLVRNIFNEVGVFLTCLGDAGSRERFLELLPQNILSHETAIAISEAFNGLPRGSLAHFGEDSAELNHPFCDLFLAGLLGVIRENPDERVLVQSFRQPHDPLGRQGADLPDSTHYLVHPALSDYIARNRHRGRFHHFQHVAVGEKLVWQPFFDPILQVELSLREVQNFDFVDATHELIKKTHSLLKSGSGSSSRAEIEATQAWNFVHSMSGAEPCAEVLMWLEELFGQL